jgi:hypothetical protein
MADQSLAAQNKLPEQYFMKMTDHQVDARYGKLKPGQVVPMDQDTASRFLGAGLAEQVSSGEFKDQQDRRAQKVSARQNAFAAINDQYAAWDVSTYRDVLTAPEKGLRLAIERGIPLVNVHMLRDEDGDPIPPDADIDTILEARDSLHPDLVMPFSAHDRSSVMGGGSMYQSNVPIHDPDAGRQTASGRRAERKATQAERQLTEPAPPAKS